ncbi:TPA: hypothetical protein ACYSC8_000976 [Citrobacter freundii]|nr:MULTISPECIES: hypothetical protein [Citrobacter]MCT4733210.1 hypothetical protein [Citrobacter freundii]MDE9592762.1 hypothetical protein [Citrobacter freundii]MDE9713605.1 hypothetical protein [Citrobacter freundii]MDE9723219.1 hypothetical protein [Citrobacter freundii]MDE9732599.1 hypothetical protein [Citrobacter freundii]
MHRIDTPTAQKDKFGAGKNGFTRGNPQTGTPATDLDDDYFDMLQEELAGVVEASGVNLEKSKHNQLLTALKALLLSRAHPFADIKADGAAAIAEALSNLGITQALALKAPLASPSFSGTPSVPTADQAEIDFRIANTAFVAQAIANLNGGAPAVLNTLKKLASAINNDANFYSTVNSALGQKASLSDFTSSKTSTSVVGNQPGGLRFMCGYITVPTDSNGNIFITLPDTFLGGVIYFEAHQCGSSYVGDNSPFVFSSYQPTSGPTSSISFAVRAATTGVPLINDSIQLMYFVRGY